MLVTLVRIKEMYWITALSTSVFWLGVLVTKDFLGINSLAIFKLFSGSLLMVFYLRFLVNFLNVGYLQFFTDGVYHVILPILIMLLFLTSIINYLPVEKGLFNLLIIIMSALSASIIGFLTLYFTSKYYKAEFNKYFIKILKSNK